MVCLKWPRGTLALATMSLAIGGLAQAQDVVTFHPGIYRVPTEAELAQARPLLPTVTEKQVPRATLLRHNQAPRGLVPGVSSGGARTFAFGNGSPTSIMPYDFEEVFAGSYDESYPARVTGQLSFNVPGGAALCSASMIQPGVLVTAAHCVFSYGKNSPSGWYSGWVFSPARTGGFNPYGSWTASTAVIATVYYNGTDNCAQTGVICNNDLAMLVMNANGNGQLPGNVVGYYGYGWNGYSFASSFGGASLAETAQLGYPCAWNYCETMERDNAVTAYWSPNSGGNQTLRGSAMTGGSSGGPWLANFGITPTLTTAGGGSLGNASYYNIVDAVTGWGYTTVGINTMGASWFGQNAQFPNGSYTDRNGINRGAGNIGALVAAACNDSPNITTWC